MHHVITVHVENKPGVLSRVSSMFARRNFNIHSLTVGPTTDPSMSQMTVVVDGPEMEQVIKQLYKLVNVVRVAELPAENRIDREILLVRVASEPSGRAEILEVAAIYGAEPVDVGTSSLTLQIAGEPARLRDFLALMERYGVLDLVKSGRVSIAKDPKGSGRRSSMPRLRTA